MIDISTFIHYELIVGLYVACHFLCVAPEIGCKCQNRFTDSGGPAEYVSTVKSKHQVLCIYSYIYIYNI